jgi:hypothetical protein
VPTDPERRAANRLDIEPIVLKIASLAGYAARRA